MTLEVGERSAVGRNFITKDCPPMQQDKSRYTPKSVVEHPPILFALPGRICAVVTPPAIASSYDASCVLRPSMLRSQGRMGALREFVSLAPAQSSVSSERKGSSQQDRGQEAFPALGSRRILGNRSLNWRTP